MNYPMKEINDPFIGPIYREMTPAEYDEQLEHYREYIKNNEKHPSRRIQEYLSYLKRWFGDGSCDGLMNFQTRYNCHVLPMAYNIYFN